MFPSFEELTMSDPDPELGAVGFTSDTQNLYIYTAIGWTIVEVCNQHSTLASSLGLNV